MRTQPQYLSGDKTSMKSSFVLAGILVLALLSVTPPVQAFTAKNLDIAVLDTTDAIITFDYDLTWYEHAAVFMRIADPGRELRTALETSYGKPVVVTQADGGTTRLVVKGFAAQQESDGTVTMTTPALSFGEAEKILDQVPGLPGSSPRISHPRSPRSGSLTVMRRPSQTRSVSLPLFTRSVHDTLSLTGRTHLFCMLSSYFTQKNKSIPKQLNTTIMILCHILPSFIGW